MTRLNALQPLGLLLLRFAFGAIFIAHAYPSLFHSKFVPMALIGHQGTFPHLMISRQFMQFSLVLELFAGVLLIAGLFTRIAALLLALEMGFFLWNSNGDFSSLIHNYGPLVLAVGCFALATLGAGRISADYAVYESGDRPPGGRKGKGK